MYRHSCSHLHLTLAQVLSEFRAEPDKRQEHGALGTGRPRWHLRHVRLYVPSRTHVHVFLRA
jgi:hypothetical protein